MELLAFEICGRIPTTSPRGPYIKRMVAVTCDIIEEDVLDILGKIKITVPISR